MATLRKSVSLWVSGTAAGWLLLGQSAARPADPPETRRQQVRLRTEALPTPLVLPGDPYRRAVNSVEIRGEFPRSGEARGSLVL